MTGKKGLLPANEKAALSRAEAAEYVGLGINLFDTLVGEGKMPKPRLAHNRKLWIRHALDKALAELPEEGETQKPPSPWRDLSAA